MIDYISSLYLIQRVEILERPQGETLSKNVKLEYMGSAEFEFGALPQSLRTMQSSGNIVVRVVTEITQDGKPLYASSIFNEATWREYVFALVQLREGKQRTKELTRFAHDYKNEYSKTDFWWDLNNHVMFSFNADFMEGRLLKALQASFDYMDKAAK